MGLSGASHRSLFRQGSSRSSFLVILLVAFLAFFALSPWGAYERAKYAGTVTAYERFLKKHPDSSFVDAVRTRLAILKLDEIRKDPSARDLQRFLSEWGDTRSAESARAILGNLAREQWRDLENSSDVESLHQFEIDYAGTPESESARERRTDLIPRIEWKTLQKSVSLEELEAFIIKRGTHEVADLARKRITELSLDYAWVRKQDRLDLYQKHLLLIPNSPHRAELEKRIIDLEVAAIIRGNHGVLPPASPLRITGGNSAEVAIENQTSYTLTVRYSGSRSYRFDLAPSATRNVTLASGPYQVAATVSSSGVIPYAGSDTLSGGSYGVKFFIETRRTR